MALVAMTELTTAMGHSQGANRHEAIQVPPWLEADRPEDSPVRFMEAVGEALARDGRGVRHAVAAAPGRPSSQPGARRKLDLDGALDR
jgi:hypothetical protein